MGDDPEYDIDFRKHPERYEIGRGEEGVFKVQPYKDELLPHWAFADSETARESAETIYEQFETYRENEDFIGMDMARKYLQMGYTRAMRYAKYPGGKKYEEDGTEREPERWADPEKRESALLFEKFWKRARQDDTYRRLKEAHKKRK